MYIISVVCMLEVSLDLFLHPVTERGLCCASRSMSSCIHPLYILANPVDVAINLKSVCLKDMTLFMYDYMYKKIHVSNLSDKIHTISKGTETLQQFGHCRYYDRLGVSTSVRNELIQMEYKFNYCNFNYCNVCRNTTKQLVLNNVSTTYFSSSHPQNVDVSFKPQSRCKNVIAYRRDLLGTLFKSLPQDVDHLVMHMGCFCTILCLLDNVFYIVYFLIIPMLKELVTVDNEKDNLHVYNRLLGLGGQMIGIYRVYQSNELLSSVHNYDVNTNTQRNTNHAIKLLGEVRQIYDQFTCRSKYIIKNMVGKKKAVNENGEITTLLSLPHNTHCLDTYTNQGFKHTHANRPLVELIGSIMYKIQADTSTLNDTFMDF